MFNMQTCVVPVFNQKKEDFYLQYYSQIVNLINEGNYTSRQRKQHDLVQHCSFVLQQWEEIQHISCA